MRTFGRPWFNENSMMGSYSSQLGSAVARQKTTLALNAAKVEAELASKSKSEFIANMSHELRTPLNAIIGFSDMLVNADNSETTKVVQYSGYIKEAAEHLLALINGILDVSKIQAGKLTVDRETFDLRSVIESTLLIAGAKAKEKNITLQHNIHETAHDIYADPLRLKQILINLLSNSVKFTPAHGAVLIEAMGLGNGIVRIIVSDNGEGMTPTEVDTALTPFGQIHGGLNKSYEGTGLGLPISVALVRLHNGTLEIESEKGAGTRVIITFPPGPAAQPQPQPNVQAPARPTTMVQPTAQQQPQPQPGLSAAAPAVAHR